MTDQQIHDFSKLHAKSDGAALAGAVQALVTEALSARAAETEGHKRMAQLAQLVRARGQWTRFREYRIQKALQQPLRKSAK